MSLDVSPTDRDRKKKSRSIAEFRRALRFLRPHWYLVTVSIASAFFVGLTFAGGLGTLLPVLRLLVTGDTVQGWIDEQVVERRLGVKLTAEPTGVRIDGLTHKFGAAGKAGLKPKDILRLADGAGGEPDEAAGSRALTTLADPSRASAAIDAAGHAGPITLALPPVPWYLRWAQAVTNRIPVKPVPALAVVLGFIAVLTVVGNVVRFFQEYYSDKAATLAVNDIRRRLYDHVLHLPLGFFGLRGTSDVTSRLVQDSQGLQDGFKTVLGQSIQEPIKVAFAFGLALWFDWHMTLFIVLFGPLMFAIIRKFGKKMRRASRKALQSSSSMLGQLEATLIGIRVVKGGVAERFERRRYTRIMDGLVGEQLKMSRIDAISTPVLEVLTFFVVGAITLYAAYLVRVAHTLDATTFMGLMACLMGIGESLRKCSKVNNALQKSNAAATRIFELLDVPVESPRVKRLESGVGAAVSLAPIQREVRFENVTFTYPGASAPALRNVDLAVPKGKCVAIVGRNGSGKTTLLALLPRFFATQQGRISIDGVDVRTATLRSLRRQIGIVTQEAIIFPGTIAENIAYGQPRLLKDRDAITAAARRAFAHDFILEKPQGYDTVLGEHGAQLSGGQRQRLCIARAILRRTPILILDEATSQVDAESEHLIQQAIESLMHERTTFVIAHRFSTILSADTIVVLERGQIVGQGKHEDLLATCETYQQLYERQLLGAPPAPPRLEHAAAGPV